MDLRSQMIKKTHAAVFKNIRFFKDKSIKFNSMVVHELRPIFLQSQDLLYNQYDTCNSIYFIHEGRIRLFVDLKEYITDEILL